MFAQEFDAASFLKGFDRHLENAHEIRMAVREAKKYILDYNASRQLCDLANPKHWEADMPGLRQMARSPHQKMWVEFNNRARRERLIEMLREESDRFKRLRAERSSEYVAITGEMAGVDEVIPKLAWLIETHPMQPSTHRATLIMGVSPEGSHKPFFSDLEQKMMRSIQVMPFAYQWDAEDAKSPWGQMVIAHGNSEKIKEGDYAHMVLNMDVAEITTGMLGNKDEFINITKGYGKPLTVGKFYKDLSKEFAGELRYIMAFVASLSATKIVAMPNVHHVGGRHASGRTLPAYEITEVRITVPRKRHLAKYIGEHGCTGIKKREHDVERYWRVYTHGSGPFCHTKSDHVWELGSVPDKQHCTRCPAWRTFTIEHKRGDKELGRIEHVRKVVT